MGHAVEVEILVGLSRNYVNGDGSQAHSVDHLVMEHSSGALVMV